MLNNFSNDEIFLAKMEKIMYNIIRAIGQNGKRTFGPSTLLLLLCIRKFLIALSLDFGK